MNDGTCVAASEPNALVDRQDAEKDESLLYKFDSEIGDRVPHWEGGGAHAIANPTPLIDVTDALVECAKVEFGLDIATGKKDLRVLGKFESEIFGGSIKVRPAVEIVRQAIVSGRLDRSKTVFEATSGNFGIALGLLSKLGIRVVALVSRRIQDGVFQALSAEKVHIVNLDVDLCPAPGLTATPTDQAEVMAKLIGSNLRDQLVELGFDRQTFDANIAAIEDLLARQDVINLAKLLASIYGGFCPEQYDNELNLRAHEEVTGPEIDEQLRSMGSSLGDFQVVCAFGTGGTSGGISRYVQKQYDKRNVHVVFPLASQDVAGIRTREKAVGIPFYEPERYAGQHEVDFEPAKKVMRFLVSKGFDIGESGALTLYAALQMINYGAGERFVIIIADGVMKYAKEMEAVGKETRLDVSLQDVLASKGEYSRILWTHPTFVPREEGMRLLASSLGVDEGSIKVVSPKDIEALIASHDIPERLKDLLPKQEGGEKTLLLCLAGGTSLRIAHLLADKGVESQSLTGGIIGLAASQGKEARDLVKVVQPGE